MALLLHGLQGEWVVVAAAAWAASEAARLLRPVAAAMGTGCAMGAATLTLRSE